MKIAVVSIAKNEAKHIERWFNSTDDADYRFILDTGSTDNTLHEIIHNDTINWAQQEFNPWRFDHARNAIWEHIPDDIDYVIWLDMDEVLAPGWRQAMETIPAGVTRPRYRYVWSWNDDGSEGLVYGGDKICARHGYYWKHPCHEVLKTDNGETQHWVDGLEIHHHPDPTKSRSQYFDLLKLAVEESPKDDRNQFYLAREYYFHGDYGLAQYHFSEFLKLSFWGAERAAAYRYLAKMRPDFAEGLLYKAVSEDPARRENWVALAMLYHERKDWPAVYASCLKAFRVTQKPLDYLCEADAWGWLPHDLMAVAAYHLGEFDVAWEHGVEAVALNPNDERLQGNLRWYCK